MPKRFTLSILLLLSLALSSLGTAQPANAAWQSKVDAWLLDQVQNGNAAEFLVLLKEQANLSGAASLATKTEKGTYVYQRLVNTARQTQGPLLAELQARGLEYRPYWIANLVWVRGDVQAIQALAAREDVAHLYANPQIKSLPPEPNLPASPDPQPGAPQAVTWNLQKVNAPQLWALGYTGQGVVIGGQDTGYQWDHPGLKPHYRGWNGSTADHNYNWHDAIHTNNSHTAPGNPCGFNLNAPCDDYGHGTHTMGIMVGDDGAGNQVGMAPAAKWIGCRNMEEGWGSPESYTECFQWFLAPTDLGDKNPQPSLAPDIINNSWGCPTDEGCNPDSLRLEVEAIRAAGILNVQSAGNSGPNCSTVTDPASIYDASFTVGNTDSNDGISSSSSRGPVTVDGSGRLKPDITAPGQGILSTIRYNGYGFMSGTSMAAPHVAGLAALLISARPALRGHPDDLEYAIEQGAVPLTTSLNCGGTAGQVPNNVFGWGRIDALGAYSVPTLIVAKQASSPEIAPGGILTYTLAVTNPFPSLEAAGVVLTDTLPLSASLVSATQPYILAGRTLRWDLGNLAGGQSRQVQLVVQVDWNVSGAITNAAYGARGETIPAIQGMPVITPVTGWAPQVAKTAPSQVAPGQTLTYTLAVTNTHPFADLNPAVLTDPLPAGVEFVSATSPYTLTGSTVAWRLPSLPPQASDRVELAIRIPLEAAGEIHNQGYSLHLGSLTFGGAPVVTRVIPFALGLEKNAPSQIAPGGTLTYTLAVANSHPFAPVHHLVLSDTLPANTTFLRADPPAHQNGDVFQWELPELAAGRVWQVELAVQVPATFTGTISNTQAGVRSDETPFLAGPPAVTQIHTLAVGKSAAASVWAGELLTYTLAVTNRHPELPVHSVVLTDSLPAHTNLVSSSLPYTQTGQVLRWELPVLPSGTTWQVILVVQVNEDAPGAIVNLAYGAFAKEAPQVVSGEPVVTRVRRFEFYMPWVTN